MLVDRALTELAKEYPEIEIERVDVLTQLRRSWNDGIRMVPTLKNNETVLTGIFLSKKEIRRFLAEAR